MAEVEIQDKPAPYDHWFWLGDFNEFREPFYRWKEGKRTVGSYSVPRLLKKLNGDLPPMAGLLNTCGLSTCVNPAHWHVETPRERQGKRAIRIRSGFHGEDLGDLTEEPRCAVCNVFTYEPCNLPIHEIAERKALR